MHMPVALAPLPWAGYLQETLVATMRKTKSQKVRR